MLFSIRVLNFRVMAHTTNIRDFLHLLSLIKIIYNVNFGGNLAFAHPCHKTHSFFKELFQGEWRKPHLDRLNRGKIHTIASIHLFVSFN
jgi:hypothetical protein